MGIIEVLDIDKVQVHCVEEIALNDEHTFYAVSNYVAQRDPMTVFGIFLAAMANQGTFLRSLGTLEC